MVYNMHMEKQLTPEYGRTLFAMAHTDIHSVPYNNHSRTMRLVVEANTEAWGLWVRFSNRCGTRPLVAGTATLALCGADGTLLPETLVPLTAGGVPAFEIPPGGELLSDSVRFPLVPGQHFAISLYYPEGGRVESGNWMGVDTLRSRPGNFTTQPEMPRPSLVSRFARTIVIAGITNTTTTVAQVVAQCESPGRVIACFGDSITQQSNWTTPLQKLLHHHFPGQVTLCNLGISGNRLLHPSPQKMGGLYGAAGLERFDEDVLSLPGLTHCIIQIGTNDIGHPGWNDVPESELITLEAYAAAMRRLCEKLHARNVLACAATLCPRALNGSYTTEREALRLACNEWIRTAPCFDAVLDFDAVLRREDGEMGMKDGYALPDGLHPAPLGGLMMAKSIDLNLFEEVHRG